MKKAYYIYEVLRGGRRRFITEVKVNDETEVRKHLKKLAKEHPGLSSEWDALRAKYVKNKLTGEMVGPKKEK